MVGIVCVYSTIHWWPRLTLMGDEGRKEEKTIIDILAIEEALLFLLKWENCVSRGENIQFNLLHSDIVILTEEMKNPFYWALTLPSLFYPGSGDSIGEADELRHFHPNWQKNFYLLQALIPWMTCSEWLDGWCGGGTRRLNLPALIVLR